MTNESAPWTAEDEKTFRDLIVRHREHRGNTVKILEALIKRTWPFLPMTYDKKARQMRDWLIANADEFCDALKPFDRGTLPVEISQGKQS
jgi:hypothetical protein